MTKAIADGVDATGIVTVQFIWNSDGRLLVDDFTYGPAACAAASAGADDTLFAAHLRAILDMDPDLTMRQRAQPMRAVAATQRRASCEAASTADWE